MSESDWADFRRLLLALESVLDDEAEADRVRDKLDTYWHRMTDDEQQRARDLSVELESASQ